jgi:acyl-CoA thioester hydrolase
MSDELTRAHYRYWLPIATRWGDNDMLGHVNNVVYFRYFEAVVVKFVIEEAGLDWQHHPVVPYAVDIRCHFRRPLSFPELVDAGLIVQRLGNTSVTYGLALFAEGDGDPAAVGHFIHVYVERDTGTPVPIPAAIRSVYQRFA